MYFGQKSSCLCSQPQEDWWALIGCSISVVMSRNVWMGVVGVFAESQVRVRLLLHNFYSVLQSCVVGRHCQVFFLRVKKSFVSCRQWPPPHMSYSLTLMLSVWVRLFCLFCAICFSFFLQLSSRVFCKQFRWDCLMK